MSRTCGCHASREDRRFCPSRSQEVARRQGFTGIDSASSGGRVLSRAVPSPLLAQDALFGERSDLGMEAVAEVQILETVNDERCSHSSVVGELDQVFDVADEEGGLDRVESEGEQIFRLPGVASLRTGFTFLESVNLVEVFQERACVMKRGPHRIAMRVALEEIVAGYRSHNMTRQQRGWKLAEKFCRVCEGSGYEILQSIRMGRMTALQKEAHWRCARHHRR